MMIQYLTLAIVLCILAPLAYISVELSDSNVNDDIINGNMLCMVFSLYGALSAVIQDISLRQEAIATCMAMCGCFNSLSETNIVISGGRDMSMETTGLIDVADSYNLCSTFNCCC